MQIVRVVIAADRAHIGVKPLADAEVVAHQRHALPLGQRLHDLGLAADLLHRKVNLALHAVQIIVDAAVGADDDRRGDALQVERRRQHALKGVLDDLDGALRLENVQHGSVARGKNHVLHSSTLQCRKTGIIIAHPRALCKRQCAENISEKGKCGHFLHLRRPRGSL